MGVLCCKCDKTRPTLHAVAAEYPHSTLKCTPTRSSHRGTTLYETYTAGQEELGCVVMAKKKALADILR